MDQSRRDLDSEKVEMYTNRAHCRFRDMFCRVEGHISEIIRYGIPVHRVPLFLLVGRVQTRLHAVSGGISSRARPTPAGTPLPDSRENSKCEYGSSYSLVHDLHELVHPEPLRRNP